MTVTLEFHRQKPAGKEAHRPLIPGLAKVFFTGMAVIPLMFTAATGTPALSPDRQPPRASEAPLIDSPSLRHADSGKVTVAEFMQSYTGPQTERILDYSVELAKPDSSLRQLAAAGYKVSERRSGRGGLVHSCTLVDESDTFSVTTDLQKDTMRVSLKFKKENDRYNVPVPGTRSFDASDFIRLVRRLPENPEWAGLGVNAWSATRIFLDKIDGTDITRAFFVPMDSMGQPVTALGNGKYLVFALIYHEGCIVDGRLKVLYDKDGIYSLPIHGEKK